MAITRRSPRSGPMFRLRAQRGRSATSSPTTALLRVGHVETRGALHVGVVNTRSMHLDAAASSRAMENTRRASGHSATLPKEARGSPYFESSKKKLLACFGCCGDIPEARPGRYCYVRTRKLLWLGQSITRSLVWNEDMNRAYERQKRAPSRAEIRVEKYVRHPP